MKYSIFVLLCSLSMMLTAQNGAPLTAGARGLAMGGTGVTFTDIHSLFSNQAGLGQLETPEAIAFVERRFVGSPINTVAGGIAAPIGFGTLGLSVSRYGIEAFNEQKIALSYARQLAPKLSIGVQFDYLETRIENYGKQSTVTFEAGLQAQVTDEIRIGVHTYNPTNVDFLPDEPLPSRYNLGLTYQPIAGKSLLMIELEKDIDYPVRFRAGAEYNFLEQFYLRAGIATQPATISLGLGVLLENGIGIDIASMYHQVLGITPSLSFRYGGM